jgi:FtsH-binding integral membrane protein
MITIDLYNPHVIVTFIAIVLMILASVYGDSEKSTAWMFFLGPLAFFALLIYWLFVLTNVWLAGGIVTAFAISAIIKGYLELKK